ncbi:MAG: ABC transporter permease [Lachnospiraceae bacterium]|jgi:ABC-type dipeptide/oligopeptide/nickel transport systems, permease components|nr:ABC transporter permease [Lachnospiraceae bacterium]
MDKRAMKKIFFSNKMTVVCTCLLLLVILASLLAPLSPYDPDAVNVSEKLQGISGRHILGTDDLGRDTFTRALYGGRISLLVGAAAMCVAVIVGTFIGTISGYKGGKIDMALMRIVDIFLSVPSLLFIIVVYAFMPRNMATLVLMLAFFSWTKVARVVRAQTLSLKERDFVTAARALGVRQSTIIWRHIIPNLMPQVIVAASLSIANAILDESALSFLGYGVQLPMASWGSMLQSAQQYILHNPLLAVVPGTLILITVLCFNVLGDMLQQILDPKLVK